MTALENIAWDRFAAHESIPSQGARGRRRLVYGSALGLALLLGIPMAAQAPFPQFPIPGNSRAGQHSSDDSSPFGADNSADQKRLRLLNDARQKALVSDTNKLLELAKELKQEMASSDSAVMTDAQLRKLAEIQRLAKSIKEKMSFSIGAYPSMNAPLISEPGFP